MKTEREFIKCNNCGGMRAKGFSCECVVIKRNQAPFKKIDKKQKELNQ